MQVFRPGNDQHVILFGFFNLAAAVKFSGTQKITNQIVGPRLVLQCMYQKLLFDLETGMTFFNSLAA